MFEIEEINDDPRFAGTVTSRTRKTQSAFDRLAQTPAILARVNEHTLDSPDMDELHGRLMAFYRKELAVQEDNRIEQATDFDFYDGIQWTERELQIMRERGQTPLTFNVCAQTINWMLGSERRSRVDYKILPREEDASQAAERKSELLKYLSDVNRTPFDESRAFADAVKGGIGWIEDGVRDEGEGEPIYTRYESWRNMLHDTSATELDLSDSRYIFRTKRTDADVAYSMFPDRKGTIREAAGQSESVLSALDDSGDDIMDTIEIFREEREDVVAGYQQASRMRVRLIECWFRVPVEDQYLRGGQFSGELFDMRSEGHQADVMTQRAKVVRKVKMRMHVAIMCESGILHLSKSPYRHNQFPFTPIWCYRRDRDNQPYGLMRQMRDPQSDVNRRAAKALQILSSNKVIMDSDAVTDMKRFEQEVGRPDAILIKKPGSHLELDADRGMDGPHIELMQRSIGLIQSMTGVTDESMGRTTNATSGKAIIARQDQGSLATSPIMDNLRLARQVSGEKRLSLVEQYMTERKKFRITNQRGQPTHITVNDGLPENDIVRTKADFVISETDFNATMRQAQVEELLALMQQLAGTAPQLVLAVLDIVVETMDVPQREELVKRIRSLTGQADPDADPNNPDEETQQANAQKQMEAEMAMRAAQAELMEKEASAKLKMAQAEKAEFEARKIMAEIERIMKEAAKQGVEAQVRALEAAAQLISSPGLGAAADHVMAAAGAVDHRAPQPAPMPLPPETAQPAQIPQQPTPM